LGLIVEGIRRVKPQVDFIVGSIPKVNVKSLQEKMEKTVYDCFRALTPLSYEYRVVCTLPNGDELCIGEWVRVKYSRYQKYGTVIDYASTFFNLIRSYGLRLKPWVRKPIKWDFERLVELAVSLKPYREITVEIDIPETVIYTYWIGDGGVTLKPFAAKKIVLSLSYPSFVTFVNGEEKKDIHITDGVNISAVEDVVNHIVELYRRADAQIVAVREHNEKVLEEMNRIAEPWKLTNIIKNGGF